MRIVHKGMILVLVPLVLTIAVLAVTFSFILQIDAERIEEMRQRSIADTTARMVMTTCDLVGSAGHMAFEGKPGYKRRVIQDVQELRGYRDTLLQLDPDSPVKQLMLEMSAFLDEMGERLNYMVRMLRTDGMSFAAVQEANFLKRRMAEKVCDMSLPANRAQNAAFLEMDKLHEEQQRIFKWQIATLVIGVLASALTAIVLARAFMVGISRRLLVISDNTFRMSTGAMLNPPLGGKDEIASVDAGFHTMAAELREAIAKEKALFDNASDLICVADRDFKFTDCNPACLGALGFSIVDLRDKSLLDVIVAEDRQQALQMLEGTKFGASSATFEARVQTSAGRVVDLLWSIYFSELDASFYVLAHDISERKQLERAKEEFLAMVSHDLRSPLSAIFGTFKLIHAGAFGPLPAATQEKVTGMMTNSNRLLALVNDLLDVEKLESGKMELARKDVVVSTLIAQAAREVEPVALARGVKIGIESRDISFSLDEDRMMQVLINLLSNAIKYSPEGGTVRVNATIEGDFLSIEVADNGRGVPKEHQAAIFERFKQVRAADQKTGTGLGLPICKLIVEAHEGTIGVRSEGGAGSAFWMRIPTAATHAVARAGSTKSNAAATGHAVQTRAVSARNVARSGDSSLRPALASRWFALPNLSLMQKGAILVLIPLMFELLLASGLGLLLVTDFQKKEREYHNLRLANYVSDWVGATMPWAYCMHLQDWQRAWTEFNYWHEAGARARKRVWEATKDEPTIRPHIQELDKVAQRFEDYHQRAVQIIKEDGLTEFAVKKAFGPKGDLEPWGDEGIRLMRQVVDEVIGRDTQTPERLAKLRRDQGVVIAGGVIGSILISVVSGLLFGFGIVGRLKIVEENVKRLEKDEPLLVQLTGKDEIAHLDRYIHTMAAALAEARRKEKAVFDNSQDIMCAIGGDGMLQRINPACRKLWGYAPDELIRHPFYEVVASSVGESREALTSVATSHRALEFENKIFTKSGAELDVLWSLSWSESEKGVVAIGRDISQRKALERLKQEFLSMVSHDMRTPLASISMTAELLCSGALGTLDAKVTSQLEMVVRNCERLLSLINDLLDVHKLESGQMRLTVAPVAAADIVRRSVDALSSLAEQKGVRVNAEVSRGLVVSADADRMVQVLVNLLSNAIKFSPEGGTVWLKSYPKDTGAEFAVRDEGRGVPSSHVDTIFERFKQVEASDGKRNSGGTGLGLPICKQIIEQHGGKIGVESQSASGSIFWFFLPQATIENAIPSQQVSAL